MALLRERVFLAAEKEYQSFTRGLGLSYSFTVWHKKNMIMSHVNAGVCAVAWVINPNVYYICDVMKIDIAEMKSIEKPVWTCSNSEGNVVSVKNSRTQLCLSGYGYTSLIHREREREIEEIPRHTHKKSVWKRWVRGKMKGILWTWGIILWPGINKQEMPLILKDCSSSHCLHCKLRPTATSITACLIQQCPLHQPWALLFTGTSDVARRSILIR